MQDEIKKLEVERFIFKQISVNSNFSQTIRWNALKKYSNMNKRSSKTGIVNRCVKTTNKKNFNKISKLSRIVFLKLLRTGQISGFKKAVW